MRAAPPRRRRSPLRRLALLLLAALAVAPVPRAGADGAADPPGGRVWRRAPGFVRVPAARLAERGLRDAARTSVARRGRAVPTAAPTAEGDLVFLAVWTAGPHSVWAAFDLRPVAPAATPPPAPAPAPTPAAAAPLLATRALEEDRVHGPVAAAERAVYDRGWPTAYLARVPAGQSTGILLDPGSPDPAAPQTLAVEAVATHAGPVALRAVWGSLDLGTARAEPGAGPARLAWEVPAGRAPAEAEVLVLTDVSPPPPPAEPFDVTDGRGDLWVDRVSLAGPVLPVLDGRLRAYDVVAGTRVALRAPEGPAHLALVGPDGSPAGTPAALRPEGGGTLVVQIPDVPAGTRLFASTAAEEAAVEPARAAVDPVEASLGAAHLVVAVPALLEPARRLAAHRTRQGIPSAVVDVRDVYEAHGYGERDPEALRAFLRARAARAEVPLRFVLLAGDATLDRTDVAAEETIPAAMARTKYNGATPADRLYVAPDGGGPGGPAVGRLPFRRTEEMAAYVDRVVAYETSPPADPTRRVLRFVTGEGRFSPAIDAMIERRVQNLLATRIPAAYDAEMTYANPRSPFFWPAATLGRKVVDDLNRGSLFLTYVGHGFAQGFDRVQGHAIFHVSDVDEVEIRGTPPAVFVFACTTALFDDPARDGVGEALMKRPRGPLAYFGATRICHPAANAILGQALAERLFSAEGGRRLGETLDAARDEMLRPAKPRVEDMLLRAMPASQDLPRLFEEAAWMYVLLGDPALRPALPAEDLVVSASLRGTSVAVEVGGDLPDGAVVRLSVEVPRQRLAHPLGEATDDAAIRENHRRANDKALARADATASGGVARAVLLLPEGTAATDLVAKAWLVTARDVRQGAAAVAGATSPPR